MTVFKGFLVLTKRNLGLLIAYLTVFMAISLCFQLLTKGEGMLAFEEESLNIAVIDRDQGELSNGLKEYLGKKHHLIPIKDDKKVIQEKLFYRDVYYVVTIPEDFERRYFEDGERLQATKVPGTFSAFYIDQQIDAFLNGVKVLKCAGFSTAEAVREAKKVGELDAEVTMLDRNGFGGGMAPHAYMFQFMPYLFLSVLCFMISYVMLAYRKQDVRRRLICSGMSMYSQNMGLVAGYLTVGLGVWLLCMLMPTALYGKEFLEDPNLWLYLLNSLLMLLVSLSTAFVVGVLVEREEIINAVTNVISLGMCFTCGVFVSMSVLSKSVRAAAQFLPVYWYETVNEIIGNHTQFSAAQTAAIWKGFGIQFLFAVAIFSAGLVAVKYKGQE